jgi:uncharacterized membrane protein YvlD (DUF360 family)
MRRVIDFYRLQIEVMRTWQPTGSTRLRRILVSLVVSVISLWGAVTLLPGVNLVAGAPVIGTLVLAAIVLGLLNLFVRPLFLAAFAGVSVIAVVVATLVFQVASFLVLPAFVHDLQVNGILAALVASFVYATVNTILVSIFSVTSDDSYFAILMQQVSAKREDVTRTDKPGLVVVQIDGLAQPILARQVRAGRVPHLSNWLRSGRYRLSGWEALLPPTTPASQAGILHGNNDGIPAFRWYEKGPGRIMVANHPEDALEVATRISNGEGLCSNDGASVGNLFSGDAARSYITMATIKDKGQGLGKSQTFITFFASPYNYLGTIVRFVAEIIKENIQARRQVRAGVVPRMHRGRPYPIARAATNVALRDLSTSLVIEEMYRGAPVIYVDYTDYDEIAHHSGPERPETFDALDGVDRAIATLEKAAASAPRPYRFVIVSDHGQTLGATFLQRYGKTLGDVVKALMDGPAKMEEATARVEEWGPTNAFLSDVTSTKGVSGGLARAALRSRTSDGVVELRPSADKEPHSAPSAAESPSAESPAAGAPAEGAPAERPDLIAIASGNLGLVYFPQMPGRVTVEQLAEAHPGLVDTLARHQGIGAMLVKSEVHGSIVIGRDGINFLEENRVEGVDPVAQYGGRSREAFLRLDGMDYVPDLSVISLYDPEFEEVAAFEELIGSHGGLGGPQTQPLIMHPADWELDEDLVGAPAVYRQIRRWAERHLDHRFGRDGTAAPLPMPERPSAANADETTAA